MLVWIDTVSGTWGEVVSDQGSLVLVDLAEQAAKDVQGGVKPGHDAYSLLAALDGMSDGEITEFGLKYGTIPTLPKENT